MICGFKQKFKNVAPTYFAEKMRHESEGWDVFGDEINNSIDLNKYRV